MRIASVVAAYDERENIEALARRLDGTLGSLKGVEYELVFVVEGTDGTHQILEALRADIPAVRILYQEKPHGLGNAFRRGFAAVDSGADFIVTMDADLNHQPEEIPRLLEAIQTRQADILVGSRFIPGARVDETPLWKLFLSGTLNVIIRVAFGLKVKDKTSGFRIYRTTALRSFDWVNEDFAALPEMLIRAARAGLRVEEAPIHFIYRRRGTSKMYFWPTAFSYLRLLRLRLRRPRRGPGTTAIAVLVALVSVAAASCARSPERGTAAPASRPAPIPALPDEGFRVAWISNTIPKEAKAGSTIPVSVSFRNIGTAVWLDAGSTGSRPPHVGAVRMSYRWLPSGRRPAAYAGRTELTGPLRPGQSTTLEVSVSVPSTPGAYRLQFDLVQEFVAWFEWMDAPRLVVPVRVL